MQYVLFDVETTGLSHFDEVIQFCCFITDEKFSSCTSMIDFYSMSTQHISPGAFQQHHISLDRLRILSNGLFFEEQFYEAAKKFEDDCIFVYYSPSNFDVRMVNQTLAHAHLPYYDFGTRVNTLAPQKGHHCFDLQTAVAKYYKIPGKKLRLANAVEKITNGNTDTVVRRYRNFNKTISLRNPRLSCPDAQLFHNARFDVFSMWYVLYMLGHKFIQ